MGLGFVLALGLRVKVRVRGFAKGLMAFAARFLGVQLGPSVVLAYSFSICGMLRGRNAQSSEFGVNQVLTLAFLGILSVCIVLQKRTAHDTMAPRDISQQHGLSSGTAKNT